MLKSVEGIVVRSVKYGETSLILDLLTPEDGISSFIVSSIRKKGKRGKSSLTQILNIVKVEAYVKDNGKLSRIKEISLSYVYKSIPFDVVKSSVATFIVEICRNTVKASDDYHGIYHYVIKGLIHLDNQEVSNPNFHIIFLLGLLKYVGFDITNNYDEQQNHFNIREGHFCRYVGDHRYLLNAQTSHHLSHYLKDPGYAKINRVERKDVLKGIVTYYQYHIDGFGQLNSLAILETLFS